MSDNDGGELPKILHYPNWEKLIAASTLLGLECWREVTTILAVYIIYFSQDLLDFLWYKQQQDN